MPNNESNNQWKKDNSTVLMLRVTNKGMIPSALDKFAQANGISRSEAIRKILTERLKEEGLME